MAWTSPRTWLAGEKLTAANLNTHVRDNFNAIGDVWTPYTPSWTAPTTNPVIGNGTITGRYIAAGKYVTFAIRIIMGSTTTYGSGAYLLSYPVVAANLDNPGITGYWFDSSAAVPYAIHGIGNATDKFRMLSSKDTSFATSIFPFTLATGDKIIIGGTYEAA